jgi:hypothetical protein
VCGLERSNRKLDKSCIEKNTWILLEKEGLAGAGLGIENEAKRRAYYVIKEETNNSKPAHGAGGSSLIHAEKFSRQTLQQSHMTYVNICSWAENWDSLSALFEAQKSSGV